MRIGTKVKVARGFCQGCVGTIIETWELPFGVVARVKFPAGDYIDIDMKALVCITPNLANPLFARTRDEVPR